MRIPLGNAGNRVAEPSPPVKVVEEAFDTGVGKAFSGFAKQINATLDDQFREQQEAQKQLEREERARKSELKRIESMNAHGASVNGLEDLLAETDGKIRGGEIERDKAGDWFRSKAQSLQEKALKGVSAENQEITRAQMLQDLDRYSNKLSGIVRKHEESALAGGIMAYGEQMKRYAASGGEAERQRAETYYTLYLDDIGQKAGFAPATVEKLKQDFREQVQTNAAIELVSNDPGNALQALKSGAYEALEPKTRLSLIATAGNELERMQRKAEAASEKHLRTIEQQIGTARDIMERGGVISPQLRADLDRTTRGTSLASSWAALQQDYDAESKYRLMRPAEKQAAINDLNTRIAREGVSNPAILQDRNRLESMIKSEKEALAGDGYSYAVRQGIVEHVPIDLQDVLTNPGKLKARIDQSQQAGAHYGITISPLTNEESEALAGLITKLPDATQAAIAGNMVKQLGPQQAGAIFRQVQAKDPTFAAAGMLAAAGAKTTFKRSPSEVILKGRALIAAKQVAIPDEDVTRNEFNRVVGTAILTPSGRDTAYRSALQAYATLMQEEGKVDRKEIDTDTMQRAIRMVTGGIVDFGAYQVLPPRYGMRESAARDLLKGVRPDQVKVWGGVAGMSEQQAAEYLNDDDTILESVGIGRYRVRSGAGYLKRPDGRVFEMIYR